MNSIVSKSLEPQLLANIKKIALTLRGLSIDMIEAACSGHPGLPLGCADLVAYLYGYAMRYNPQKPHWLARDRFILSAGHGSALLYAALHVSGYEVSLEDLKDFRQLHSVTPGHPEKGETAGVETTTGPLGQGFATAVGTSLGLKIGEDKFGKEAFSPIGGKVYVLAGDGDMMEGITSEASSFAGHLQLDNLVVIYDSNDICLDGPVNECFSEDVAARYRAYGWEVYEVDGHDFNAIHQTFSSIQESQQGPVLVIAKTTIGYGSPGKAGTHGVHGAPLGAEEVLRTKEVLELPLEESFYVPTQVKEYFGHKNQEQDKEYQKWCDSYQSWAQDHGELAQELSVMQEKALPQDLESKLSGLENKTPIAGRAASHACIQLLGQELPWLYGGSADLSCSDKALLKGGGFIAPQQFSGRNIKFGVREFAMGAIASGMAQSQLVTPFVGTFLTFSDYMRNAIRLAALMKEQVIYQFTHDSIFLGEDGPTHQPVEHVASLRALPGLQVFRPADSREVQMSWLAALRYQGPSALILSRQGLPLLQGTEKAYSEGVGRGAYILKEEESGSPVDYTLFASGSEVTLAADVAVALTKLGKNVRVVSMPCWELFEREDKEYQEQVVGGELGVRVSIEAGSDLCWYKYIGRNGIAISVDSFGASAPAGKLQEEYGFTVDAILERLL